MIRSKPAPPPAALCPLLPRPGESRVALVLTGPEGWPAAPPPVIGKFEIHDSAASLQRRLARQAGATVVVTPQAQAALDPRQAARWRAGGARLALLAGPEPAVAVFDAARRLGAMAVLPGHCPRHPLEWRHWLAWLADARNLDFFETYLGPAPETALFTVRTHAERLALLEHVALLTEDLSIQPNQRYDLRLVIDELINNAVMHGPARNRQLSRSGRLARMKQDLDAPLTVRLGQRGNRLAVSVGDPGGALLPETLFRSIHRHLANEGLFDESGRGLFLAWSLAHRLLLRHDPGRWTEVCALFLKDPNQAELSLCVCTPRPLLALHSGTPTPQPAG